MPCGRKKLLTLIDKNQILSLAKFQRIDDREAEGTPLLREHTTIKVVSRVRIPLYPPLVKKNKFILAIKKTSDIILRRK